MSTTEIINENYEKIYDLISAGLKIDRKKILPTSRFIDDLGADSLDQVELIMALEEEFDLDITEEDSEKFRCVQDIIQYIESKKTVN